MLVGGGETDEELMRRVRDGDPSALEPLFARHHQGLYRFFRRLTASAEAAEDLVQEVFVRILWYGRRFRAEGSFRGWLYRIARHAAADRLREAGREVAHETIEVAEPGKPAPDRLEERERLAHLSRALSRLSPEDREVLLLARFQELSGAEIAQALGCSPGAARVRVHRALSRLRDLYHELSKENVHAMR